MNFRDLPKEKKEQLKIMFKDLLIVLGIVAAFYIFVNIIPSPRTDIYDKVTGLVDDDLFGTYFIILSAAFMYSLLSMVYIHNRRVRGQSNPRILLYSNVISSLIFIYMIYLMLDIYSAIAIGIPFVIALLFMFYFNAKLEYYALKAGMIINGIEDIKDEFKN